MWGEVPQQKLVGVVWEGESHLHKLSKNFKNQKIFLETSLVYKLVYKGWGGKEKTQLFLVEFKQ